MIKKSEAKARLKLSPEIMQRAEDFIDNCIHSYTGDKVVIDLDGSDGLIAAMKLSSRMPVEVAIEQVVELYRNNEWHVEAKSDERNERWLELS